MKKLLAGAVLTLSTLSLTGCATHHYYRPGYVRHGVTSCHTVHTRRTSHTVCRHY